MRYLIGRLVTILVWMAGKCDKISERRGTGEKPVTFPPLELPKI